jgi:small subunit ribosomal protein S1
MDTNIDASAGGLQPKMHLTGKVVKTTLAGAIIDIGQKLPGVVHISQLKADPVNRVEDVVQVGQSVDVWVRRVRDDRVELTMVQPLALDWKEIETDMVVKGKVARLEAYGAFIEIGAERPGLVHVSEISHDYVKTPGEVLKEGDEVEARVLGVDRKKKQIRLSIKATQPKPEEIAQEAMAEAKKEKGKGKKNQKSEEAAETEAKEPELTVMEIAYREALEKNKGKKGSSSPEKKKTKSVAQESEEIFSRTLKNRITDK